MMTKIACLTTAVVALTVSVTAAAESFATTINNGVSSSDHHRQKNNPRQRRMKKGGADGAAAASPHQTSRTSHQTSRTSHHQTAPTQAHTTSRTSSHTPPKDTTRHQRDDEWYDDYFLYFDDQYATAQPVDDAYYAGEGPVGVNDDRYYYQDDLQYMDDAYLDDIYYEEPEPKASKKSKKSSKKSKKSSKKGKKDSLLNDDFYGYDDYFAPGNPRPTILLETRAASPPALLSVPVGGSTDSLAVGTIYPFGNLTYNADSWGDILVPVYVQDEEVLVNIRLDGYCTRIGSSDNTVEGYCHFTYTAVDPQLLFTIGQLTAEGPLANPNIMENNPCSALQVTGGTGFMTGANGMVQFCPSILNDVFTPPVVASLPSGGDLFEDAQAYEHLLSIQLDQEFAFVTPS